MPKVDVTIHFNDESKNPKNKGMLVIHRHNNPQITTLPPELFVSFSGNSESIKIDRNSITVEDRYRRRSYELNGNNYYAAFINEILDKVEEGWKNKIYLLLKRPRIVGRDIAYSGDTNSDDYRQISIKLAASLQEEKSSLTLYLDKSPNGRDQINTCLYNK